MRDPSSPIGQSGSQRSPVHASPCESRRLAGQRPRWFAVVLRPWQRPSFGQSCSRERDPASVDAHRPGAVLGQVVIEGSVEWLTGEHDRFPRRLQAGSDPSRQHTGPGVALPLEPHQDIADFEPGFFQAARQAVDGSRSRERGEVPAGLERGHARRAPLAGEFLESLDRVCTRRAPFTRYSLGVELAGPVPLQAVDADAIGRVGEDHIRCVGVELGERGEAVRLYDLPATTS